MDYPILVVLIILEKTTTILSIWETCKRVILQTVKTLLQTVKTLLHVVKTLLQIVKTLLQTVRTLLQIVKTPFANSETLLQTVKTQMKCSIMLHFIRVYTVYKGKKKVNCFENYNLTPLDIYNEQSQVYCIKHEGTIH